MASVADWSQTPASNTTLGGISTDGSITLVNQLDNMSRGMMAEVATSRDDGTIIAVYPRGYLHGLTLSNNGSDATNDIDIAAGEAVTSDSPYWRMALASALTKRLDAAWAVGTGNGGRMSTAAITDTTYHVWLIKRSDTGVVDVGFDVSATSPTMPANYDRKRRIGSILRESGAIVAFTQRGDTFLRTTQATDRSSTAAAASALLALSVPAGIVVEPLLSFTQVMSGAGSIATGLNSAGSTSLFTIVQTTAASEVCVNSLDGGIFTNTSRQIQFQVVSGGGTLTQNDLRTRGWVDDRGRSS